MDLKKELQQIKTNNIKHHNDVVSEVKLLLAGDASEDLAIMRHLASNSKIVRAEEALGRKIELEKLENDYGEVYTIDQIEKLCIKYKLRFLPSRLFKGDLPVTTIHKIKQFAKETTTSIDPHSLNTKFFIIAPAESFELNYVSERAERERIMREKDPVLFYQIDSEHYRMIHKWGNDFTIFRRVIGFIWENKAQHNYTIKISYVAIMSVIIYLLASTIPDGDHLIAFTIHFAGSLLGVISILVLLIAYEREDKEWWSKNNWNNTSKMVR